MAQTHTLALQACDSQCESFAQLWQSFPSTIEAISPVLDQLMRFILQFRSADGSEIDIELAVREALVNAIVHGNGGNASKRVDVGCSCYMSGEVAIKVRDHGPGFDTETVPDPTAPENKLVTHGRGIYLMKALMDDVSFEDGGAVVRMRKKSNTDSVKHRKPE